MSLSTSHEDTVAVKEDTKEKSGHGSPDVSVDDYGVVLDTGNEDLFDYDVDENPNVVMSFAFALQQVLVSIGFSLSTSLLVSDIVCARDSEMFKARLLSTTMFISGLTTFLQNTIGIRLPLYQGPAVTYVTPLLIMAQLPEWTCPDLNQLTGNISSASNQDIESTILGNIRRLEGSLMIAGAAHMLIGLLGGVGFLLRFIGPVTVVPALTMLALVGYKAIVKFAKVQWGVTFLTVGLSFMLSFYLRHHNLPIPAYKRGRGLYIKWYPLHKMFSVLIACMFGWAVSGVMTAAGVFSEDPNSDQYFARTDSRLDVIRETNWFIFPYPGQFGAPGYDTGAMVTFILGTISSIIDSIGDYYACHKVCRVPPPQSHAVNRGIAVEGLMSFLGGWSGAGHATSTFGINIGAIGVTRVASLRVFQCVGIVFMLFGIFGKLGAVFITIPYSVIGGLMIVNFGVLVGVMLSNLQFVDMNSTRNMAIIGVSMIISLMVPYWISSTPNAINSGNASVDNILRMFSINPVFISAVTACFLDNTVPGTKKERGLLAWNTGLGQNIPQDLADDMNNVLSQEEIERNQRLMKTIYTIPYADRLLKRFPILRHIPVYPR